jgi:hypothetical protein
MFAIKCPRCEQTWYSDEKDEGRVRLCSECAWKLRNRKFQVAHFGVFATVAAVLLVVDVLLVASSRIWPDPMASIMLLYGLFLTIPSLFVLRIVMGGGNFDSGYLPARDVNWNIGRWPAMTAALGLACVLAFIPIILHRPLGPSSTPSNNSTTRPAPAPAWQPPWDRSTNKE